MRSVCRRRRLASTACDDVAARGAARVDVGTGSGLKHLVVITRSSRWPFDQPAEDLLGLALVVLVGGVEEVDAGVAHRLVHRGRRGLVGVAAEGHGAEAELRRRGCRYGRGAWFSWRLSSMRRHGSAAAMENHPASPYEKPDDFEQGVSWRERQSRRSRRRPRRGARRSAAPTCRNAFWTSPRNCSDASATAARPRGPSPAAPA